MANKSEDYRDKRIFRNYLFLACLVFLTMLLVSMPEKTRAEEGIYVNDFKSLNEAVKDPSSENATIIIATRIQTSSIRIPNHKTLRFLGKGLLELEKRAQVVVEGAIEAPLTQIFAGPGRILFHQGHIYGVYPQWWGAKGDGVHDDTAALAAAVNCGAGSVLLGAGDFLVSATVSVPTDVSIIGLSPIHSKLTLAPKFKGSHLFRVEEGHAHNILERFYIEFKGQVGKGGVFIPNPYDYTLLSYLVGNQCAGPFIELGDGQQVSQTVKVDSCLVYGTASRNTPLFKGARLQECFFVNNKFFGGNAPLAVAEFDRMTGTTFLNNSFTDTKGTALRIFASTESGVSGNKIIGNIFENCRGDYAIEIISFSPVFEGEYNSVLTNRYLNSKPVIYLENLIGTQVFDAISEVVEGPGARRSLLLTTTAYPIFAGQKMKGMVTLSADGNELRAVDPTVYASGGYRFKVNDRTDFWELSWQANRATNEGLFLKSQTGKNLLRFSPEGDVQFFGQGGGIVLTTPDGKNRYRLTVDNQGQIVTSLEE
jgi:hypothetical protein